MDKPFDGDGDGDQEVPVGRSRTRKIRRPLSPGRGLDDVPIRKARGRAVERAGLRQTSSRLPGQSDDTDSLHRCMAEMNISTGSEKSSKQLQEISQKKSIELPVPLNDKEVKSKKGTSGRPVCLNANYFRLETVSKWQLYQYRVDFEPEEDRKMVQSYLLREHKETLRGYLFDGTMLFSPYKYDSNPLILFSDKPSDKTRVRIMIREVGYLAFEDKQYVNIFNILLRRCLHSLHLQLVGRYYFDSSARIAVDNHRLELWPGYVTSIRQHETDLLLCTEITHKVMRQDTVHTLLKDCYKSKSSNYQTLFKQTILGAIVLTEYNNKTYRIDDVDFSVTPASTFECKGNDVSYISYYAKKYDLHINDPGQPMLVTMPKKRDRQQGEPSPIYLVPELCKMTGLSDQMRSNFKLMRSLADHTRLDPSQRMDRLQHFNRRLHTNSLVAEELKSWNMEMSKSLVSLSGRILPSEYVILGSNTKCESGGASDWTNSLRSHPMLLSKAVNTWLVVVPEHLLRDTIVFVTTLRTTAYKMGLQLPDPSYRQLCDDRLTSYMDGLQGGIISTNPELILVVLPNNRSDRYSAVKKKCCVDHPVPTQVILHKNISGSKMKPVAVKLAIQMNCKLGGAPWTVEIPLQKVMVVGFDVYHDSLHQGMSIGALVASLDKAMIRYFSAVSYHRTGEELSNELSANICKALQKFKEYNNGCLPQRIIIYRDGVGEGQIQYVKEHEVDTLEKNLSKVYGGEPVKMAFIVVTKRINTRLFYNGTNPPPGTVVDDVITLPSRYDFFLVSQSVLQGTVSPTSYNVIYDNVGLDADKLQRLTYKLTHMYFNWSGTVRVPAPCQYAHKLAYLVGQALHQAPSQSRLQNVLYFL